MTDTIEEIRARHEDTSGGWMHGYCDIEDGEQAHNDRATLLRAHDQDQIVIQRLNSKVEELEELLNAERERRVEGLQASADQACKARCELLKDDTASDYRKGWFAGAQAAYEEAIATLTKDTP